jgi:hypothetical protein
MMNLKYLPIIGINYDRGMSAGDTRQEEGFKAWSRELAEGIVLRYYLKIQIYFYYFLYLYY